MGCINCGCEFIIKKGEKLICPECGKYPFRCWSCHNLIGGDNIKECVVCSPMFYICPYCGCCSKDCVLSEHIKFLRTHQAFENANNKTLRKVVEYFYNFKRGNIRQNCPEGVGISYAHQKLKNMAIKLQGYSTRGDEDTKAFNERFDKIENSEFGRKFTVTEIREDGSHGQEDRDVLNLGICMGHIEKKHIIEKNEKGNIIKEYDLFVRINGRRCEHLNFDSLVKYQCPKCTYYFDKQTKFCPTCKKLKGKNKGQPFGIKRVISTKNLCSLGRGEFKPVKEEKNGEEEKNNY